MTPIRSGSTLCGPGDIPPPAWRRGESTGKRAVKGNLPRSAYSWSGTVGLMTESLSGCPSVEPFSLADGIHRQDDQSGLTI